MKIAFKICLIKLVLLTVSCGNIPTSDAYKEIDPKIIKQELRKAEKSLEKEDIHTALDITKKYALMGHAKAQFMYGNYIYLRFYVENYGKGMNASIRRQQDNTNETTLKWMTYSAQQGYAPAQYSLSRIHSEGKGVKADPVVGLMWGILSTSKSNDKDRVKDTISEAVYNYKLTAEDITRAKKMASEWKVTK